MNTNKIFFVAFLMLSINFLAYGVTRLEKETAKVSLEKIPVQIKEIDLRITNLKKELEEKKDINTKLKEELVTSLIKQREGLAYELYQADQIIKGSDTKMLTTAAIAQKDKGALIEENIEETPVIDNTQTPAPVSLPLDQGPQSPAPTQPIAPAIPLIPVEPTPTSQLSPAVNTAENVNPEPQKLSNTVPAPSIETNIQTNKK